MDRADRHGVVPAWTDAFGRRHRVPAATIRRLHEVLDDRGRDDEPLIVRAGQRVEQLRGRLHLEEGAVRALDGIVTSDLPLGYHRLDDGGDGRSVIVVPRRCPQVDRRQWGVVTQLYALRSASSWGIGDLGDLDRLAGTASRLGAGFVLLNPLHASSPVGPQEPSPYSPSTRRALNPLYVDVAQVAGDVAPELIARARELNRSRVIDRDAVHAVKQAALEAKWARGLGADEAAFVAWLDEQPCTVRDFATWSTLVEQHGSSWRRWPAALRRPDGSAVRQFAVQHRERVRFHCWVQWLLQRQLGAVEAHVGTIYDLPIGFEPDGFDAWTWQDLLASECSVGAPPDEFNTRGQDWTLPPFVPSRLAAAGYQPFIDTLRAVLRGGGNGRLRALRIDHVMGLFRLWWVLDGSPPDGAYVRNRHDDLLGLLALEASRAGVVVIGEDLGTVEAEATATLTSSGILSFRVALFEQRPPRRWKKRALSTMTTHDLPTVAGLWSGDDLREQVALDVAPNVEGTQAIRRRLARVTGLNDDASDEDAVVATHQWFSRAPSDLLGVTLEDLGVERRRPNIPGTTSDTRANWSMALVTPTDELLATPTATAVVETLAAATADRRRQD